MDVTRYTFQSPYSSQIQIGKPDPTSKQEAQAQNTNSEFIGDMNKSTKDTQVIQSINNTTEVEPTIKSEQLLDLYA